jgi:2-polyprenyl-6-methoxyphenol hydroxylase-like FAD-dependent oxidoreductase
MAPPGSSRIDTDLVDGQHATVLIIGAGVVGCLTAIKLAESGIDVQIVESLSETSDAPRACGYFGAVQEFLDELGLYKLIRDHGFMTRGLCWRGLPKDDEGEDRKRFGQIVAVQPLCAPDDESLPVGSGLLNLTQGQVNKLFLQRALQTGRVRVDFGTEFVSLLENSDEKGVILLARDMGTQTEKQYRGKYCVGADGSHSKLRKALGLPFPGHQWPERLLATNVRIPNVEDPVWHTYYFMAEKHWGVATPLEKPVLGKNTLWRYAIALPPEETRTDDELLTDEHILGIYETRMPGPRPLQAQIEAKVLYRIHQRLAPTLRKGMCLLAGDAAHVCNVSQGSYSFT